MPPDPWSLYALMLKSRLFEEATARLWHDGLISGELHLGTGEEAVIAGVVPHLGDGDAMALDHRGSAALLMRGVDPVLILRELLGYADGLCGGMGGHMHLFSREHLAASSGIVGSAGPAAAGFALAAQYLHPGKVAVGFFGEGATNQGMLLESLNLAAAWGLPVLFVCKNDSWAITTRSTAVTGGDLNQRAQAFGIPALDVDGGDVVAVWEAARAGIERARAGGGPTFLQAHCIHLEGHFLGFQLLRMARNPIREMAAIAGPLLRSLLHRGGAPPGERIAGLQTVLGISGAAARDPRRNPANDPLNRARQALLADPTRLREVEQGVEQEIHGVIVSALAEVAP